MCIYTYVYMCVCMYVCYIYMCVCMYICKCVFTLLLFIITQTIPPPSPTLPHFFLFVFLLSFSVVFDMCS